LRGVELFSIYRRAAHAQSGEAGEEIPDAVRPVSCTVRRVLVADDGLSTAEWQVFRSLLEARSALARRGLIRVPRGASDEPALVETWL
jgi:hypothetical protein